MNEPNTTVPGYVNRNQQRVVRHTELQGTDHGQRVYVLRCGHCGTVYGANGSDIFQRLCPSCQNGMPGLKTDQVSQKFSEKDSLGCGGFGESDCK